MKRYIAAIAALIIAGCSSVALNPQSTDRIILSTDTTKFYVVADTSYDPCVNDSIQLTAKIGDSLIFVDFLKIDSVYEFDMDTALKMVMVFNNDCASDSTSSFWFKDYAAGIPVRITGGDTMSFSEAIAEYRLTYYH